MSVCVCVCAYVCVCVGLQAGVKGEGAAWRGGKTDGQRGEKETDGERGGERYCIIAEKWP